MKHVVQIFMAPWPLLLASRWEGVALKAREYGWHYYPSKSAANFLGPLDSAGMGVLD